MKLKVCQATGPNSYKCLCEFGFYGTRCESYSMKNNLYFRRHNKVS